MSSQDKKEEPCPHLNVDWESCPSTQGWVKLVECLDCGKVLSRDPEMVRKVRERSR